ncbi:MAG: TlpA family protein disulfide reductase [Sulfurovaceae bacterium]|nr:TlpA family protein disulfide reductase [Sulfurovaceae bacterium]
MNKKRIILVISLSTTMLLNTGCMQSYFADEKPQPIVVEPSIKKLVAVTKQPEEITKVVEVTKEVEITKPIEVTKQLEITKPTYTIEEPAKVKIEVPKLPTTNNIVGCENDISNTKNNCNRGKISKDELKTAPQPGEQHILQSIRGKTITIGERKNGFTFPQYKNKIIILEIFGKDCPHCIKEIPIIKSIRNRYKGKLEVIAIQAQGRMDRSTARNYINQHGIRYPVIEGDDATNLLYFIQTTYGWMGILPYTLVIKNGVTEFSYSGETEYQQLKKDIDSII